MICILFNSNGLDNLLIYKERICLSLECKVQIFKGASYTVFWGKDRNSSSSSSSSSNKSRGPAGPISKLKIKGCPTKV